MQEKAIEILSEYGLAGLFIGVTLLFIHRLWTALTESTDLYEKSVEDSRRQMQAQIEQHRKDAETWRQRYLDEARRREEERRELQRKLENEQEEHQKDLDEVVLYIHKLEHKLDNN